MNRLSSLFRQKTDPILSVFFTAGYPNFDSTLKLLNYIENSKIDMIEIGVPFSDPIADGTIIQKSSRKAIENGVSLSVLLEQLSKVRKITQKPLLLMGYFNPFYKLGFEKVIKKVEQIGLDGFIIPDLSMFDFNKSYQDLFKRSGLSFIQLVTPNTSEKRLRKIDAMTTGFIYAVSSSSTTGNSIKKKDRPMDYFERINNMKLKNPIMCGFGIRNVEHFMRAGKYFSGSIIGSRFIEHLNEQGVSQSSVTDFVKMILNS